MFPNNLNFVPCPFKTYTMKTLLKICFVLFLGFNASAQKDTVQNAVIKTNIVCDHCSQCETCGGLLERKLIRNKGIQMITLDAEAMTINVIYNSKKTDLTQIRTAISKLGYDADEIPADPEAVEKLDGCCKA